MLWNENRGRLGLVGPVRRQVPAVVTSAVSVRALETSRVQGGQDSAPGERTGDLGAEGELFLLEVGSGL